MYQSPFTTQLASQEHNQELTQPWCKYSIKWAITSWWWDQGLLYIPHRAGTTPENSSNLGVSILSGEPSHHGDEIRGCCTSHTGLVPHLRTHPTLVQVSSPVSHHNMVMRSGVAVHPTQGWYHTWELIQPWCKYPLRWAITSWWWDQGLLYIPHRAGTTPENSSNLGVSILSSEPSHHGDDIGGCSTSYTGLVPILHLCVLKLWLTETLNFF